MRYLLALFLMIQFASAELLKPYTLAYVSELELDSLRARVSAELDSNGLDLLGEYAPAGENERWVQVVSSEELSSAAAELGGLAGFGSALRIGYTLTADGVVVSYTTPLYWGNAYFGKETDSVEYLIIIFEKKLVKALEGISAVEGTGFGSEEGMSPKELQKYHYMFGMEYFDDVVELKDFDSFEDGVETIEAKLGSGVFTKLVYALQIPDSELKLYGIALSGETGEEHFLPIIDIGTDQHTSFLPYEILLTGNQAVMMHGRFRIALSFPDLTMMTFSKIMSTPGDIEDLMRTVTD